jgi:hypothetical protein
LTYSEIREGIGGSYFNGWMDGEPSVSIGAPPLSSIWGMWSGTFMTI